MCVWTWSVSAESDPWRVTSGPFGGRGGEWGGRWQHVSSPAGSAAAVPPSPPGTVPHSAGRVPGYLPPAGGELCEGRRREWWRPGATCLPSLPPFAPSLPCHRRAREQWRWLRPKVRCLLWINTHPPLTNAIPVIRCAVMFLLVSSHKQNLKGHTGHRSLMKKRKNGPSLFQILSLKLIWCYTLHM